MNTGVLQNGNRRLLGMCIGLTMAINTPTLLILRAHWDQINLLDSQLNTVQGNRYRDSDAARDFRLVQKEFENVYFRFERNEQNIQECLEYVRRDRRLGGNPRE